MMQSDHVYRLENLVKEYEARVVLRVPQLTIERGEIFCIVGPSGAGKSTLLRLLNFLEPPTSGRIYFDAYCGNGMGPPPLDVQRRITTVFQRSL